MNSDVKQEKERVNQYLCNEKVTDTPVLVQVQLSVFTYIRNETLSITICAKYILQNLEINASRNSVGSHIDYKIWFSLVGNQLTFRSSDIAEKMWLEELIQKGFLALLL